MASLFARAFAQSVVAHAGPEEVERLREQLDRAQENFRDVMDAVGFIMALGGEFCLDWLRSPDPVVTPQLHDHLTVLFRAGLAEEMRRHEARMGLPPSDVDLAAQLQLAMDVDDEEMGEGEQ